MCVFHVCTAFPLSSSNELTGANNNWQKLQSSLINRGEVFPTPSSLVSVGSVVLVG